VQIGDWWNHAVRRRRGKMSMKSRTWFENQRKLRSEGLHEQSDCTCMEAYDLSRRLLFDAQTLSYVRCTVCVAWVTSWPCWRILRLRSEAASWEGDEHGERRGERQTNGDESGSGDWCWRRCDQLTLAELCAHVDGQSSIKLPYVNVALWTTAGLNEQHLVADLGISLAWGRNILLNFLPTLSPFLFSRPPLFFLFLSAFSFFPPFSSSCLFP